MTKRKKGELPVNILLEHGTIEDLLEAKELSEQQAKYHWDYYSDLARQRNESSFELKEALLQTSRNSFEIKNWQRSVKYKYSLHPFSTAGSLTYIGGRFNIGQVNSEVPIFPALYLARDKDTAIQEHLGQAPIGVESKLTPLDLALTNPQSQTIFSISGWLETVFDLTTEANLIPFVEVIKNFKVGIELVETARKLKLPEPKVITSAESCLQNLLTPEWRILPSRFDVPATSQIFGHLVYTASIEAILYCSKFTSKHCLAVFPHNFKNTNSYLFLDDEPPHDSVPRRLDSSNWYLSDLSKEEIMSHFVHDNR